MDIESIRTYCLSLPHTTEDMAFGEAYLLFRVCDRIFACYGFEREDYFVLKCNPDYAIELRDQHPDIEPAWHWNKRYWNQIRISGRLGDGFVQALIRHSYSEVVKNLPRRTREEYPDIMDIA